MRRVLALPAIFFSTLGAICAQNFDSVCLQQRHVLHTLNIHHYDPPAFTPATNVQVLDLFLKEADERSIVFLSGDREALVAAINSAAPGADVHCDLVRQAHAIFSRRLLQLDSMMRIVEKKKPEFNSHDTISFSFRKKERVYCGSLSEVRKRIDKRMKYEFLVDVTSPANDLRDLMNPEYGELPALKEKARNRSIKRMKEYIAGYRQPAQLARHLGDCMSNAISQRCDPHTNYFNSRQIENYNQALFMEESSFGFSVVQDDNGNILISELAPGGPAWKSNSLNERDLIISFKFENEPEVQVDNAGLEEFSERFGKSAATVVELKVLKKDLKVVVVKLKKEKIASQENLLNSYVVRSGSRKMGYIPIPSFYLNQEADSRQGLANDVAKEIIELKLDTIGGLILDLRYNGGGSMREAMGLAGIFIDEGPVAVYKPKGQRPFLLKDLNRGSIWDGPLVVLVNGASASASEFVSATLQDYHRAVIVGSPTFGKGTAQSVVMADSAYYQEETAGRASPFGFMKITSGRFYRVTSESHQGKGIQPDVHIPGIIEQVMEKEAAALYAFAADTMVKDVSFAALPPLPTELLKRRSEARLKSSRQFTEIVAVGDSLKRNRANPEKIALTLKDFKAYTERQHVFNKRVETLFTQEENNRIDIRNNSENEKVIAMSEYQQKNNAEAISTLKKDLILHESIMILDDLMELSQPR